jgi:hypothetical protein
MWPGVAPTNGTFNETYIDVMASLIKKLGSYGIYTIVGSHAPLVWLCGSSSSVRGGN